MIVVGRRATQLFTTAGYRDFFRFVTGTTVTAAIRRYTIVCNRRRLRCRNLRVIDSRLYDDRNNSIYVRFSTFPGEKCFAKVTVLLVGADTIFKRNCQFRRYFVGSREPNKKRVRSVFVVLKQRRRQLSEENTKTVQTRRVQRTNTN